MCLADTNTKWCDGYDNCAVAAEPVRREVAGPPNGRVRGGGAGDEMGMTLGDQWPGLPVAWCLTISEWNFSRLCLIIRMILERSTAHNEVQVLCCQSSLF